MTQCRGPTSVNLDYATVMTFILYLHSLNFSVLLDGHRWTAALQSLYSLGGWEGVL